MGSLSQAASLLKNYVQSPVYGIITQNGKSLVDKALNASKLNSKIHLIKELHAGGSLVGAGHFESFLERAIASADLYSMVEPDLVAVNVIEEAMDNESESSDDDSDDGPADYLKEEIRTKIGKRKNWDYTSTEVAVGGLIDHRSFQTPSAVVVDASEFSFHTKPGTVQPRVHVAVCSGVNRPDPRKFVDDDGFALNLWGHLIGTDAEIAVGITESHFKILWQMTNAYGQTRVYQFPSDNSMACMAAHNKLLLRVLTYAESLHDTNQPEFEDVEIENQPVTSGDKIIHSHKSNETKSFFKIAFTRS